MAYINNETASCAIKEIHALPDNGKTNFAETLYALMREENIVLFGGHDDRLAIAYEEEISPFYIMVQALYKRHGRTLGWVTRFSNWIEKEGLGTVIKTRAVNNPGHGNNRVTVFVWTVNRAALAGWLVTYGNRR